MKLLKILHLCIILLTTSVDCHKVKIVRIHLPTASPYRNYYNNHGTHHKHHHHGHYSHYPYRYPYVYQGLGYNENEVKHTAYNYAPKNPYDMLTSNELVGTIKEMHGQIKELHGRIRELQETKDKSSVTSSDSKDKSPSNDSSYGKGYATTENYQEVFEQFPIDYYESSGSHRPSESYQVNEAQSHSVVYTDNDSSLSGNYEENEHIPTTDFLKDKPNETEWSTPKPEEEKPEESTRVFQYSQAKPTEDQDYAYSYGYTSYNDFNDNGQSQKASESQQVPNNAPNTLAYQASHDRFQILRNADKTPDHIKQAIDYFKQVHFPNIDSLPVQETSKRPLDYRNYDYNDFDYGFPKSHDITQKKDNEYQADESHKSVDGKKPEDEKKIEQSNNSKSEKGDKLSKESNKKHKHDHDSHHHHHHHHDKHHNSLNSSNQEHEEHEEHEYGSKKSSSGKHRHSHHKHPHNGKSHGHHHEDKDDTHKSKTKHSHNKNNKDVPYHKHPHNNKDGLTTPVKKHRYHDQGYSSDEDSWELPWNPEEEIQVDWPDWSQH